MRFALLFLAAWLAAAGGGPEAVRQPGRATPAADGIKAELDRVAKLGHAEQQAWLRRLEHRADQAALRTLKPEEAAAERARVHRLLHQKMVTWTVLRNLLEETQRREKAAAGASDSKKPPGATAGSPSSAKGTGTVGQANRGTQQASHGTQRTVRKPTMPNPPPAEAVEVSADELAARIAGSNLAFRELESTLDEKGVWDTARLEPLVKRAEILIIRRSDLEMFRNLVPETQRASLARLESPKTAIAELGGRIFDARNRAGGDAFKGTEDERQAELKRLDGFSKRLAEMAEK